MEYYRDSIVRTFWTLTLGSLLVGVLVGCQATPTVSEMEAEHHRLTNVIRQQLRQSKAGFLGASEARSVSPPQVNLQPGDEVEVKFYYTPELDITQMVRPDGNIALQLIGEVVVQGKTPGELREELLELYRPHLRKPEVAVIVRSFLNRRVFVGGQVTVPGVISMPGKTNVLEAIMQAGGFIFPEAETRNVVVIRHIDGQRYAYAVNLEPALKGRRSEPFYLEPQDIVYVPRTKITEVGQWVDQHINNLIPEMGVFFTRSYGRTTIGYDAD